MSSNHKSLVLANQLLRDGKFREALVTVSVEGYSLPGQVLEKKLVQQRWYRSNAGWWIVWVPPEALQP